MAALYNRLVVFLEKKLISSDEYSSKQDGLDYWSQQLFVVFSIVILIFSLPLFIYGSILYYRDGFIAAAIIEILIYIAFTGIILHKSIKIAVRKVILISILFSIGVFYLITTGPMGAGMICIVSSLFVSGMFLNGRVLKVFVVTTVIASGAISILLFSGVLDSLPIYDYKPSWFLNIFVALLLGICSMALVRVVFRGLEGQINLLKKSREMISESETRYRRMFEYAPVAYQSLDMSQRIISANPAWCTLTGYKPEDLENLYFSNLLEENQQVLYDEHFSKLLTNGYMDMELDLCCKSGEIKRVRLVSSISRDQEGNFVQTHCLLQDLTEKLREDRKKKERDARLIYQQKLESIGSMAGGVAHEINNPINGIMNYAQLLLDAVQDAEEKEYAGEIINEAERIAVIVRNLLGFSRQEKAGKSLTDFNEILDKTLSLVRTTIRKDQITLEVNVWPEPHHILCISQQIQQIIMNLITNARDALNDRYKGYDENKKIIITTSTVEIDGICYQRLSIRDNGNGVPDEIRDRMFEPFFTTKPGDRGTGLGLAISSSIVKAHDGKLTFRTKKGEFTEFHLDLPAHTG